MTWTAHIDGGSRGNPGPAGAGVSIDDEKGREVFGAGFFLGPKTNNQAEYAGLLQALKVLSAAGAQSIRILTDSELMAHQINGVYRVKSPDLRPLHSQAKELLSSFEQWRIEYVPREQNRLADKLANQAMDARKLVVVRDRLNLAEQAGLDLPKGAPSLFTDGAPQGPPARAGCPTPEGRFGASQPGIEVTVVRPPKKGACRAGMKQGRQFVFTDTTPAGLCLDACATVMEAVLAARDAAAEGLLSDEVTSCRCNHPDCGAVFDIRQIQ